MVVSFYGVEQSEAALRILLKTRPAGTSPVQAMLRLPEIGMNAHLHMGSLSMLQAQITAGQPCIVHLWTESLPHWQISVIHAVTVVDITDFEVTIHDPAFADAPKLVPLPQFLQAWSATDYLMIVITPFSGETP
jgi:ABC-type bacteriocin/lantibiotic exporter with double-glycine peptidase domain